MLGDQFTASKTFSTFSPLSEVSIDRILSLLHLTRRVLGTKVLMRFLVHTLSNSSKIWRWSSSVISIADNLSATSKSSVSIGRLESPLTLAISATPFMIAVESVYSLFDRQIVLRKQLEVRFLRYLLARNRWHWWFYHRLTDQRRSR